MQVAPILSALLLAVAVPAAAGPYAPQEYDFSGMHGLDLALGVVESVRDLSVQPGAQEIVVRLDDGRELVVKQNGGTRHFHPGDRVRLVAGGRGVQVERT